MQQLRRDNLTAIVKPCKSQTIDGFDCSACFRRLSYADVLEVQKLADQEDGDTTWKKTCELLAAVVFEDEAGAVPLFDSAAHVGQQSHAFVRALVFALMAANGFGTSAEATEEAVKND